MSPTLEKSIECDSSPDPLAHSVGSRSTQHSDGRPSGRLTSPRKTSGTQVSAHARIRSQSPSARSLLPSNSPVKAITEQTLSPWKIRVTVEAEPEDGHGQARMATRTYQVPLKLCSSPLEAAEARGRAKKAAQSSPARKKRSGTPVRGGGSRRKSVTDLNITVLGDDEDENEWSPNKRTATKRKPRQSSPVKRISAFPVPSEDPQEPAEMYSGPEEHYEHGTRGEALRELDLNRVSVRTRSASIRKKETQHSGDYSELKLTQGNSNHTERLRNLSNHTTRSYPTPSPTPSAPGEEYDEESPQGVGTAEEFNTILESEGFTMIDLDSIPSVKHGFSSPSETDTDHRQVSVLGSRRASPVRDSPEQRQEPPDERLQSTLRKGVKDCNSRVGGINSPGTSTCEEPAPEYLRCPKSPPMPSIITEADVTELSSNVASSPPVASNFLQPPNWSNSARKVTPDIYSSPKLPSPPKQCREEKSLVEDVVPPKRVVKAGTALQNALSSHSSTSRHVQRELSSSSQGDFLEGFSSGTKRELRAGLRLGEELAKRRSSITTSDDKGVPLQLHKKTYPNSQVWRGETLVQRSPFATDVSLQTKEQSEEHRQTIQQMSKSPSSQPEFGHHKDLLKPTAKDTSKTQRSESPTTEYPTLNHRQEQREREWKLEREAISRQINEATPGDVIVLDSSSIEGTPESVRGEPADPRQASSCPSKNDTVRQRDSSQARGLRGDTREEQQAIGEAVGEKTEGAGEHKTSPGSNNGAESSARDAYRDGSAEGSAEQDQTCSNDEDETDIWLAEAQLSSSSPKPSVTDTDLKANDLFLQGDGQAQDSSAKPRRSLIPSPWKRGEDLEESTMLTNGDASGMLWHKPIGTKFGATALARQTRKISSGNFDVDRMLSSPSKLAVTGRKKMVLRKPNEESSIIETSSCDENTGFTETDFGDSVVGSSIGSSPPQPVKIPVKFNDSFVSADVSTPNSTRTSHEDKDERPVPHRPATHEVRSMRKTSQPMSINIPARSDVKAETFHGETPISTGRSGSESDHEIQLLRARAGSEKFDITKTGIDILTPPSTKSSSTGNDESRPPTPRSALKGGRISAGLEEPGMSPTKRVVFHDRSRYLNENGDESTMSANFDSPVTMAAVQLPHSSGHQPEPVENPIPETKTEPKTDSWTSWFKWGFRSPSPTEPEVEWLQTEAALSSTSQRPDSNRSSSTKHLPGATSSSRPVERESQESVHRNDLPLPGRRSSSQPASNIRPPKLPSYLLPPSYPTIPKRSVSSPLLTHGDFTNTHFRTLHILHAKSRYAGFHTPKYIRREIQELRGMKVTIDETDVGSDEFEWTLGFSDCAVLERFCREVEWDWVCHEAGGSPNKAVAKLEAEAIDAAIHRESRKSGGGGGSKGDLAKGERTLAAMSRRENKAEIKRYWDVLEREGRDVWTREMRKVEWGWSVEQLARWLGRIVIGEEVREEENKKNKENEEKQDMQRITEDGKTQSLMSEE